MATLGNTYVDLIDVYKQADPNGSNARIIELLKQQNPILDDAIAMECNSGGEHKHKIRTGYPSLAWGGLYQGIPQSKSTVQQVTDTTGFVEGLSSIDTRVLELANGKEAQIRMNEAMAFLEAMNQEVASGLFYHDTATTPEKFKGLSARYNVRGGSGAGNQVVHAGGSGSDNTSIWFVTWGDRFTHLLYPQGTQAGVKREDKGEQRVTDGDGNAYYVKEEKFTWHVGLAVADWRYNARVANIDVSDMQAGSVDLYSFLRKAYYKLQSRMRRGDAAIGRQAIYCNRDVLEALDGLATNGGSSDSFVRLTPREIEGEEVMTYRGIPIRETDSLLNTESVVPAA
ncbi:MAG: major capsid protein [Thalassospira sp.]|uniref:major capsid protein n=1 Tax=Thalassospira sp. TaxID=1912094 RepID=UPI003A851429